MRNDLTALKQLAPLVDQEGALSTFSHARERRRKRRRLARVAIAAAIALIVAVPLVQLISRPGTETPVSTTDTEETSTPTDETVDRPPTPDGEVQPVGPDGKDQVATPEPEPVQPQPPVAVRGFEPIVQPIGDGKVLVIDTENFGYTVSAEIWDVESGTLLLESMSSFAWRVSAAFAWTGDEVVIVGGSNGPGIEYLAIAFNPTTDTWRSFPNPPGDFEAWENGITGPGVWTGETLAIYKAGLSLDPSTGTWQILKSHPSAKSPDDVAVWTGTELLVLETCSSDQISLCSEPVDGPFLTMDLTQNRWEALPAPPVPGVANFTGELVARELVVLAFRDQTTLLAFSLDNGSWRTIADLDSPRAVFVSTSASDAGYFLVETASGEIRLHEWRDSKWLDQGPVEGLSELEGNTMAWQDDVLIVVGPSRQQPLIIEVQP